LGSDVDDPSSTQFVILNKLTQILSEVQAGKREGSIISSRARTIGEAPTEEVVEEITRELEAEGISKEALVENKPTIDEFVKTAIESGAWNELVDVDDSESSFPSAQTIPIPPILTPQSSSPRRGSDVQLHKSRSTDHPEPPEQDISLPPVNTGTRTIEIFSATYGPLDATERLRNFFRVPLPGRRTTRTFVPNNTFFGGDPLLNNFKVFVMVWRVIHTSLDHPIPRLSTIQTTRSFEGHPLTIDIGGPFTEDPPSSPDPDDKNTLRIISASYHNYNVTPHLNRLLSQWEPPTRLTVPVSNEQFGHDPGYGWVYVLSVTYAYSLPSSSSSFPQSSFPHYSQNLMYCVKTCLENRTLLIPPLLTIDIANWGGLDVSDTLRAQVSSDQILRIDMNNLIGPDPWPNVQKTLSVIYTYAGEAMQILVIRDGTGTIGIVPDGPPRRSQFGVPKPKDKPVPPSPPDSDAEIGTPFEDKVLDGWRLLAVIWGHRAVGNEVFWGIAKTPTFGCTNAFFGFDGKPNWPKTCQVLVQDPGGVVECVAAREGEEMRLGDALR
jgi:hypothetical protein